MIRPVLSQRPLFEERVEGYIIPCFVDMIETLAEMHHAAALYQPLFQVLKQRKFTGKANSVMSVTAADGDRPICILLVGCGSTTAPLADRVEYYRRAIGQAIRSAEALKLTSVACSLPDAQQLGISAEQLAFETATTAALAHYHFDQFITEAACKVAPLSLVLCTGVNEYDACQTGIERGGLVGQAVNQARTWCDLPAAFLTPTLLAEQAQKIADAGKMKVTIFNQEQAKQMGMGGLVGVAQGSAQECRLVVMEYKSHVPDAPTIAVVGKGITFDSGGLSIKPANGMETMKDDMAGAAGVISTMSLLPHIKPRVNVIALAPLAENMPSGTATRPGDILRFYNGKTAEVKNTDAEGRLILADALSYAVKHYKLDGIISIATLTGSCAYALGPFFCGLMSQHDELALRILDASWQSGDRAWRLPFHDDYRGAVRSNIADICNIGNEKYRAGAITAGFFLTNFVDEVPYVHLDIAGTAFNVPDISYYRPGATGFGVRLLVQLLQNWQ